MIYFKASAAILLALLFIAPVEAQRGKPLPKDPKILKARYKRKLKLPFMKLIPWKRELADAQELSRKKKMPIAAYFTRSFST